MAEVGGYVGLLLGVSFFHFTAWISEWIDKKAKAMDEEEEINANGNKVTPKKTLKASPDYKGCYDEEYGKELSHLSGGKVN